MITRSIRFRMALWYAALLVGALSLFGAATYIGLERYLQKFLEESLIKQARSIGDVLLVNINQSGEDYVDNEITEHYSPEINGRFIRVTRADGKRIFVSGLPKDGTFDPALVPPSKLPAMQAFSREVEMSDGHELLLHGLPYRATDGTQFLIEVAAPYNQIESVLRGLLLTLALGLPLIVTLAIGGGYLLMRRALRPVDEIRQKAAQITSRSLSERLPVIHTGDELERLATDLNRMIERLEESFQQMNRFSADASHELRTPLTVLQGELEAVAQKGQSLPTEVRDTIGSALEEIQRLSKIVEGLLAISRLEAGEARSQPEPLDFAELARSTADQMRLLAEEKHISLIADGTDPVEVEADPSRLKHVVVNLLDNAIKYTPEEERSPSLWHSGTVMRFSKSRTRGWAYRQMICPTSSIVSIEPIKRVPGRWAEPGWDCPSSARSVWPTAARSPSTAQRAGAAFSVWSCHWPLAIAPNLTAFRPTIFSSR